MENNKLIKVVSCYLMQGDKIVDFWLNKYFENGDSTDMTFKTQSEMILEILRCIHQGAIYSVEIFEA
mgnify:CR=1 FL=1